MMVLYGYFLYYGLQILHFFFFKQIEGLWQLSTIMMVSIFQQ